MRNLLSAGFHRLAKDKILWIGMLAVLAVSASLMISNCQTAKVLIAEGYMRTLDDFYFSLAPLVGLCCAVYTSLFIGTEHSEGTLRNKLVVGRTRAQIYLSNYIVCLVANACLVFAWLIGGLVGLPLLGGWRIGALGLLLYTGIALFFTAAFTGIFTLLCMLSTNKAITAVVAILLAFGLLMISASINGSLSEPEFSTGIVMMEDGMQIGDPIPNPEYISGIKRVVYQFLMDALPSGQGILMTSLEIERPVLSLASSAVISLITVMAGVFSFRKKDLK